MLKLRANTENNQEMVNCVFALKSRLEIGAVFAFGSQHSDICLQGDKVATGSQETIEIHIRNGTLEGCSSVRRTRDVRKCYYFK